MTEFEPFSQVNGEPEGVLSVRDRGFSYGDGLFETMRLEQGHLPFWCFHRERLLNGCSRLGIPVGPKLLRQRTEEFLALIRHRGIRKAVVKLVVTRGEGGRGYQPPQDPTPSIVLSASPFPFCPPACFRDGVAVYLCQHRLPDNPALAGIKHLNKLDHVLAAREWRDSHCREGLLLGTGGDVIEAGSRNVFAVLNGELLTPSLRKAGVAGILRRRIVEDYAGRLGYEVDEATLGLDALLEAEEVFLTNSVTGVWPVQSLTGAGLLEKYYSPGRIGTQLHQLFESDLAARLGGGQQNDA